MENKHQENDEISLKELLQKGKEYYHYLLSQWKIIFLAGFIGAILGLTYSYLKKPIYIATLSFALEDDKSSGGGLGSALGLASSFGMDLAGSAGGIFSGSNLTELFKSRRMVEQTLLTAVLYKDKKISLAEMYIDINKMRDKWIENPKLKGITFLPTENREGFSREKDSVLGSIFQNLSKGGLLISQKDKKVAITSIEVSATNELFAKYFCEALAKEVSDFYIKAKSKKAQVNMAVLQRQVDSVRGQLNGSISRVAVANDNTFNLNPALNVRRAPASRSQVDVQANTAILTELVKQAELAKVTLRKETPLIQVIDKPILPLKVEKLNKAKGFILGGFLVVFFTILILIFKRVLKEIL